MRLFALLATLLVAAPGLAAEGGLIVDRAFVEDALRRGALVWDARSAEEHRAGHIPGAVNIDDPAWVLRDPNTEDFIALPKIERILGAAGIDPRREIVVYGTRGTWGPYFALYTLQYFGARRAHVYHDGLEDWAEAGLALERGESRASPIALSLVPNPAAAVSTEQMIARLGRGDVQIVDVRTPAEFAGEDIRSLRGGHIPGAVNIPYEQNWRDPETPLKLARRQVRSNAGMSLKPAEELRVLYAGLDRNKETIVYCQSGARASQTAGVLQSLGFTNVKVYDASWLAYGARMDAPAENVTFFNVGRLNARLAAMQSRIDRLERELATTRAAARGAPPQAAPGCTNC